MKMTLDFGLKETIIPSFDKFKYGIKCG